METRLGKHAVIVDDCEDICILLSHYLNSEGVTVSTATSGTSGLELVSRQSPDIVFVDYLLPDMLGTELIRKIQLMKKRKLKIVIVSAYTHEEIKEHVGDLDTVEHILKPCSRADLRRAL